MTNLEGSSRLGPTWIDDTFAEGFGMRYCRVLTTALDRHWLEAAVAAFCGFATSVIACDLEIGLERYVDADATPDGRPGAAILAFGFSTKQLAQAVPARTGQCLMTCPSTAVYDGSELPPDAKPERIPLGKHLRYFGDGYQKSKVLDGIRFWRIPVMDGEFVVQESLVVRKGVAGGNLILQGRDACEVLTAARRGIESVASMPGVIAPFPGGVVRSGSKVGSRYRGLKASTAHAFCPTLRGRVESQLHRDAHVAVEIVLDGIDKPTVARGMATVMRASAGPELVAISAGNYGGHLGPHHFHLREILANGTGIA